MVRKMFSTLIRRAAQAGQSAEPRIPYIYTNQYKAKRLWPPDFTKISPKHQFRLERRYKRRAKLKWARPGWTKGVKIVQMSAVVFIVVYGVLFLEWNQENSKTGEQPFQAVRSWFWGSLDSIWKNDQVRRQKESDNASPTSTATKP